MTESNEPRVTQADRLFLCDLFDFPQEVAVRVFAGEADGHEAMSKKLYAITAFRTATEAASKAQIAELVEALGALALIDMGKDEDEGAPYTTQEVWETIFRDRVQDWFSFEDLENARAALGLSRPNTKGEG